MTTVSQLLCCSKRRRLNHNHTRSTQNTSIPGFFICYKKKKKKKLTWRNTVQTFDHEFHEADMIPVPLYTPIPNFKNNSVKPSLTHFLPSNQIPPHYPSSFYPSFLSPLLGASGQQSNEAWGGTDGQNVVTGRRQVKAKTDALGAELFYISEKCSICLTSATHSAIKEAVCKI